jgi:hypothetical protein
MVSSLILLLGPFLLGLPAGLDTVRPVADARRWPGRHKKGRLRQYRRHQCAAHRPQGVWRATLLLDALKGVVAV